MRTSPSRFSPSCPYCNNDHDPAIECRFQPESTRFRLPESKPAARKPRPVRITAADGSLIGVRMEWASESVSGDLRKPVIETVNGETRIAQTIQHPIKNGAGKVTGYVTLHWSNSLGYVSIPTRED
jgi:hypothetical protein